MARVQASGRVAVSGRVAASGRYTPRTTPYALDFNQATSRVDLGTDFVGVGDITVTCRMFVRSLGGGNVGRLLNNVKFVISTAGSNIIRVFSDGSTAATSATNAYQFNRWYFLSITRTSAGVTNIYINNALTGSANQSGGTPSSAGLENLSIGNRVAGDRGYDGILSNLRIFNRILTATELTDVYLAMSPPSDAATSQLAYYALTEGSGSTASDTSGNGRNGTISNATYTTNVPFNARVAP